MKKRKRSTGKILMALLIAFFYLPIIYMIIFSFNEGKSLTVFEGFSLRWYRHMLDSQDMMDALYTTFSVALLATAVSTVVGTVSAIGLSKSRKIIRDIMEQVDNLPMMNPEIVTAIGFMLLFITFKVDKGYLTMLLALAVGLCVGFYDGLVGPGTGTFLILLFVHIFGLEDVTASGTAKVTNLCSNLAALTSLLLTGDVLWLLGLPAGLCAMMGAQLGSRLTLKKGSRFVRGMMLCVLFLLLAKMITDMLQ